MPDDLARAAHASSAAVSPASASASSVAIRAANGHVGARDPTPAAPSARLCDGPDPRPIQAGLAHGDVRTGAGRVPTDHKDKQTCGVEQVRSGAIGEHHIEGNLHQHIVRCGIPRDNHAGQRVGLEPGQPRPAHGPVGTPHPPAPGGVATPKRRRGACHRLRRHHTALVETIPHRLRGASPR